MIDNFHVMAILQTARAKALGYPLDSAKSFGLNRAIFYRAAKFGFNHSIPSSAKKNISHDSSLSSEEREITQQTFHTAAVGDEKAYAVTHQGKLLFVIGNKMIKPEEYDRVIIERFSQFYNKAWKDARSLIKEFDRPIIEDQRSFYVLVYKAYRDELMGKWNQLLQPAKKSPQTFVRPLENQNYVYAHEIHRSTTPARNKETKRGVKK